jgi:putative membrane protein
VLVAAGRTPRWRAGDGAPPSEHNVATNRGKSMSFESRPLLISGILALSAIHCGGGSTPTSNTPEAKASGSMGNAANSSDEAPENSGAQSSTNLNDPQIVKITDSVHNSEIEQARLAQQKTENPQVRQFAAMMIDQHDQARQQESALSLGSEESPLSRKLQAKSEATLQELRTKQGDSFDRAYIQAQIEGHQEVLETIRNELRPNAQSSQLQVYLQQLEPKVAQHLDHARQAQRGLQSGTTSDPGPSSRSD